MIGAIAGDIIGSVYEHHRIKTKDFPLFDASAADTLSLATAGRSDAGFTLRMPSRPTVGEMVRQCRFTRWRQRYARLHHRGDSRGILWLRSGRNSRQGQAVAAPGLVGGDGGILPKIQISGR